MTDSLPSPAVRTCGSCKYFGKRCEPQYSGDEPELDAPPYEIESQFHVCDLIKHNKTNKARLDALACVVDGSGYFSALCVKEEFGCNQWEPKS